MHEPRLRIPGLGAQRAGRAAGGDQTLPGPRSTAASSRSRQTYEHHLRQIQQEAQDTITRVFEKAKA